MQSLTRAAPRPQGPEAGLEIPALIVATSAHGSVRVAQARFELGEPELGGMPFLAPRFSLERSRQHHEAGAAPALPPRREPMLHAPAKPRERLHPRERRGGEPAAARGP